MMNGLPDLAVSVRNLTKVYKEKKSQKAHRALDSIDLDIPRGCIFGFLGPNGAGKSTFINILGGLVIKNSGSVTIWGRDIDLEERNSRAAIGIVPQEMNIDPFLKPLQLLDIVSGLYGVRRKDSKSAETLEMMGLSDKAHAYMRSLSGGMMRRLLLAKAFVHTPPILVLDEPSAGVDVQLRRQLWQNVRALNKKGVTIILTTHYLEEAEQLCDRIAIIDHGRVIVNDKTAELLRRIDSKTLIITCAEPVSKIPDRLKDYYSEILGEKTIQITYHPQKIKIGNLLQDVLSTGINIADIETKKTDLEEIFMQLTESKEESVS